MSDINWIKIQISGELLFQTTDFFFLFTYIYIYIYIYIYNELSIAFSSKELTGSY